ncbi:glycosyltransferase family 2 protein [Oleiphilus messinensis]|nr:glycosyltransferase family 2 protein [Oleiphilus messinensis]
MSSTTGWLIYFSALMGLALLLPESTFIPETKTFLFAIGIIGIWRYSMGVVHFIRGMIFLYIVFPLYQRKIKKMGAQTNPSHIYLMVTSFRIDASTTAMVYQSIIREAITCGLPTTIVASIVEMSDELLMKSLWETMAPPEHIKLTFVRIPGTGKRDGLAYGFRAISRDMPDDSAVVAVIDGDTVLDEGVVLKTVPYFKLFPNLGGLTTNEFCEVRGSYFMSEWHKLRFAQRHINMCSMALSKRVLTLTGRMSVFRASVVSQPEFIADVESDSLKHWRLGEFKFLTGDDKSSWFSLMRLGYDTFYVPNASVNTVEHPPDPRFIRASRQLMFRWYGNNLRQNSRATKLGPQRLGWFTYYVLFDQRISMWTSLLGISVAVIAATKYHIGFLIAYLLWVGITRMALTLLLLASGHNVGPAYPLMLYYNQIFGAIMKIYVFFRLDRQSWTRQPTQLKRNLASFQQWFNRWSSRSMTFSALSLFGAILITLV